MLTRTLSDLYSIIKYGPLLPTELKEAASYVGPKPELLDRDSTIEDICDFVVEYLNSDLLVCPGIRDHIP